MKTLALQVERTTPMTDYKKLCAELLLFAEEAGEICTCEGLWPVKCDPNYALLDRARAALAEPEPEPDGPTVMEIIELADQIEGSGLGQVDLVRAALARWGRPALAQPEPDVAGELTDQELLRCANIATPCYDLKGWERELRMMRAAITADRARRPAPAPAGERQVAPVPVAIAVSERLPGPEDCDAEERCWWWYPPVPEQNYGYWIYEDNAVPERSRLEWPDSWLPAHALPIPTTEPQP